MKTPAEEELLAENAALRARLEESEETLRAIRAGEVDALVVETTGGPQVFILQTKDAESNRFRSDILSKVSDAVLALDDERRVIYLNAAAERQYGVVASDVLGHSSSELFENRWPNPGDEDVAESHLLGTGHWCGRSVHVKRDGAVLHVESAVSRLYSKDGIPSGTLSVIRDVTDRNAAEQALREGERRFREMINALPAAIYTTDADGLLTHFNPACVEIAGRVPELGVDRWCVCLKLFHPDGGLMPRDDYPMNVALREGRAVRGREVMAERPDGTRIWFAPYPTPLRDVDGRVVGGINMLLDITARRRLENSLMARAEELARADRNKDEFLAMLAHELRNPLAPMRNSAELLLTDGSSDEERDGAQRIINRQIENMGRLIDDLLDVSRITMGKIELRKRPVPLGEILKAAADMVRYACAEQGQELSVSIPPGPLYLNADATRLEQVFGNLLSNASKYSGRNSRIWLTVERSGEGHSSEVIVRVKDDGAGIDRELLPQIFDLFVQATRSLDRAKGGLGIGLTLVRRLVLLHGGLVDAYSDGPGCGAEFVVRLPLLQEQPATAAREPSPIPVRDTPRRILIVDDHADSAQSMAVLQRRRGHEVRVAFTGSDALVAAAEFAPEVVLLDIGLPGMDGFEVARRLRSTPSASPAFLVALSGYASDEDRLTAKKAGFDEYMVKPADFSKLREWLGTRI